MALYRDQGVVLRTHKLGETDRIVVVMTLGHGKVRAVAKGVRRPGSKYGSRLEPTSHVELLVYEGRNLDQLNQAETIDGFRGLRDDLDRVAKASTLLEAVDTVAQEREENPTLYQMLVGALRALTDRNSPLVVPAFLMKVLAAEGLHPVLDRCVTCDRTAPLVAFDPLVGGTLCGECRRGQPITPGVLDLLRRTLGGDLAGVLDEPDGEAAHQMAALATSTFEHFVERRLRSVGVLDRG